MKKVENKSVISKPVFWFMFVICVAIAIVIAILIGISIEYKWRIDNNVLGTYGESIGGIVGSIIAFYSAYLLVKTFQNQAEVNRNVMKTNESAEKATKQQIYNTKIQVFDNKFQSFMSCYNRAMEAYRYQSGTEKYFGRNAFEMMCKDFIDDDFNNDNDYYRRSQSAVDDYIDFYSQNRVYLSVHLRMLYLLVSLVSESSLDEKDKVMYAKLIRGQLSGFEIIMLRYNCSCDYGQKMGRYCNEFNLTKHMPIIQLLEFKKYYKILQDKDVNQEKLVAGLDAMFITLQKYAKIILSDKKVNEKVYDDKCKSYSITMRRSTDMKAFDFEIKKIEMDRRGGGKRLSITEKALDCFSEEILSNLFQDFLYELFFTSNFYLYNGRGKVEKVSTEKNDNTFTCKFMIKSEQRLVLSTQKH